MIALSVDLAKLHAVTLTHLPCDLFDEFANPVGYRALSVLGHKDDVCVHFIDDVSSTSVIVLAVRHRCYYRPMQKRFSYRAYPTVGQQRSLARAFGCARVVFNDFINERERLYKLDEHKNVKFSETAKKVTTLAKRTPERSWLSEVSSIVLQQAVRDADRAYQNFFDGRTQKRKNSPGLPNLKKRSNRQSVRFRIGGFSVRETTHGVGFVKLAKIGDVRFVLSRTLPPTPTSVTVIGNPDGTYEVSFVVEVESTPLPKAEHVVGIDLGLTHLASIVRTDGTRERIENPRHLRANERKLARAQKSLSRKVKGSANREKARLRAARVSSKVARSRADNLRKIARTLTDENQVLAVETLVVSALAKTKMAKSIYDAGWGMFLRTLAEMSADAGRTLVAVPRGFASSQICSVCGRQDGKKPLHVRVWTCPCGAVLDRDYNAATNIAVKALNMLSADENQAVAGGHSETLNACVGGARHRLGGESRRGADMRLRLAGAVSGEAGTHRSDSLAVSR